MHQANHENHNHHAHMEKHNHQEHHAMMIEDFKKRFWISLILTIPILVFSPMIQMFFNANFLLPFNQYFLLVLSSIVFFYGGWPFFKGLYSELRNKNPGMMTLIGLAITVSYFYSVAVVFGIRGHEFFWELVTLIDIMLLGHWFEMRSILGASRALELLVQLLPQNAHLVKNESITDIKLNDIKVNNILLIKPGEKIPADGKIIEGLTYTNESLLTGESNPVKKETGNQVIAGSINGNGAIKILVQNTGENLYLSKVIKLVKEAQQSKSKTQNFADYAAKWLTFIAIVVGLITFIVWLSLGHEFS